MWSLFTSLLTLKATHQIVIAEIAMNSKNIDNIFDLVLKFNKELFVFIALSNGKMKSIGMKSLLILGVMKS